MLKYELYKTDGDILFYHYYPQGSGEAGTVTINKETGEAVVVNPSEEDFENRYAFKLMKRLLEFFENKTYKETGMIAWY